MDSNNPFLYWQQALRHYARFSGRVTRKAFWLFVVVDVIIALVLALLNVGSLIISDPDKVSGVPYSHMVAIGLVYAYDLAMWLPRLHDSDHSGWWILVPVVNFVFFCSRGSTGSNRFGEKPGEEQAGA